MLAVTVENKLVSTKNDLWYLSNKKGVKLQLVPVNSSRIATCLQEVSEEKAVQLSLPSRASINRFLKYNFALSASIKTGIYRSSILRFVWLDSGVTDFNLRGQGQRSSPPISSFSLDLRRYLQNSHDAISPTL